MVCIKCGAELRPQARFCNVCGTVQPDAESADSQPARPVATAEQPSTTVADTDGQASDGSGKQKRPARIPRHRDDESDESDDEDDTESLATPAATRSVGAAVVEPDDSDESDESAEPEAQESDLEDSETLPETPSAIPISDMPTQEHPVLPHIAPVSSMSEAPQAAPLDAPLPPYDLDETPGRPPQPAVPTPTDGLPWPLPPAIIVGGRYRVEELVRSSQTDHGPENVYRAHDLQAYEQCWSCGARHDIATALDPYCDQCGADMLGREFVLIERLTSDVGAAPATNLATDAEADDETRVFTQGLRTYQVAPKAVSAMHFPTGARISAYVTADHGRTRQGEANEDTTALLVFDAIYNSRHDPRALGIVADGLGGHDSGQEASKLVTGVMLEILTPALVPVSPSDKVESNDTPAFEGEKLLQDAARAANIALCAANDAQQADMGSTLVAVLIAGENAWIANMGDSRGYVYDDHGLRRVTKDHSLVEQLIDAGMITPEERYEHPQRNQILKSLGADPRLEADIFPQELRPGMRILLCSDGVWEMVRDDELARILRETPSTAEACERIVRAANENGGEDNISVVLLDASA
jgi:serine/threonine protein phosphatase PrpC